VSWSTAVQDIRLKLSDNPNDKLRAYKRVFGQIDGVNVTFKTFEFRRVTDFTSADAPLGIYKNQIRLNASDIASDDLTTGFFTLAVAPASTDVIEATYYLQFFYDAELQGFLRLATNWLGLGGDWNSIPEGLRPAALQYACGEAYQKLALRFAEHLSETYRLEDSPDGDRFKLVDEYKRMGEDCRKEGQNLRDQFYTRQGQSLQPLFGVNVGRVRNVEPSR
jgi:hypothetical protein